jgi:hypothetical protein
VGQHDDDVAHEADDDSEGDPLEEELPGLAEVEVGGGWGLLDVVVLAWQRLAARAEQLGLLVRGVIIITSSGDAADDESE